MFRFIKTAYIANKLRKQEGPIEKLPIEVRSFISRNADIIAETAVIFHTAYQDLEKVYSTKNAKDMLNEIKIVVQEILK